MHADCIFTDWGGHAAPVVASLHASASITSTVFRRMRQAAEVVDVSFNGLVRFRNVLFADPPHMHGPRRIVGTTLNDYRHCLGCRENTYFVYYGFDDDDYDVSSEEISPGSASGGVFGADHLLRDAVMSDCLFLKTEDWESESEYRDTLDTSAGPGPGCPEESLAAKEALVLRMVNLQGIFPVSRTLYYAYEPWDYTYYANTYEPVSVPFGDSPAPAEWEYTSARLMDYELVTLPASSPAVFDSSAEGIPHATARGGSGVLPAPIGPRPGAGPAASPQVQMAREGDAVADLNVPPPGFVWPAAGPWDEFTLGPFYPWEAPDVDERWERLQLQNPWFAGILRVRPRHV